MEKKAPEKKIRVGRGITATIWENKTKNGSRYGITVEQRYKAGDEWKESRSHLPEDALLMAKAYELAFQWTAEQERKNEPSEEQASK